MGNTQTHKLVELARRGQVIHKPHAHTLGDRDGDVVGKDGGSAVYLVPASLTNTTRLHGGDLVVYKYRKDKAWYWALGTIVCVESPLETKLKEPRAHRLPRLSVRRRTQIAATTSAEDAAKEVQYRIRNWVLVKNTLPGPDTQAASLKLLLHALSSSSSSAEEGEGVNEGEVQRTHVQRGCDIYGSNTNPTSFSLHREPSLAVIEVSASGSQHPEKSGTGGNACQTMYDELLARAEWSSWQGLLRELRALVALHNNNNAANCDEAEGDGVPYVTRQVLIAMLHLLHFLPDAAAVQPVQSAEEEWQQARVALGREDFMDTFQAFSALAQLGIDTLSEVADPIFDDVRERAHYVKHHIFTSEAASATLPAITAASVAATGPQTTKLYDWVQWQMSVLRAVEQKWKEEAEEGIERDARHRRSLSALLHDLHRRGLVFVPPQLPTTTTNSNVCHEGSYAVLEHIVPSSAIFGRMCCEAVVQGRVTLTCKELELLQHTAAAHHHNNKHIINNNTTITNNITQTCETAGQPACVALSSEEVSLHEESPTVDAVIDLAACTNNAPSYNEELTTPLLLRQVGEGHDVGSEHQHITSSNISTNNNSCSAHTSVTSDKMVTHISLSVTHHNDYDNVNEVKLCGAEMGNVEDEVNEWTAVASVMELIYSERGGRLALALAEVSARYELHMIYVRQSSELERRYTVHMPTAVPPVNMPHSHFAQLYTLSAQEQCERAEWCTREQKACLDLLHRMPQEAYDLQRMKLAHDYACRLETLRYTIRQKQRRHVAAVNLLQEAQAVILVDCVALQKSASVHVLLSKMREALTLLAEDECEGDFLHITSLPRSLARDLHQHYPVHTCNTMTGESKKDEEERTLERRRELTRRLSVPPVCLPAQPTHYQHHHHQSIKTNKDGSKLYVCTKELNARPMSVVSSAKCVLPEKAVLQAETEHEIELAQLRRLLEMQKSRTQAAERQISALQERLQAATLNDNNTHTAPCDAKVNYERALLVKRMAALYDTLQGRHRLAEDEEHDRREEAETELRLLHALREAMPQEALPESAQAALRACVAMVEQRRNGLAHERKRRLREEEQLSDFFRTVDALLDTTSSA